MPFSLLNSTALLRSMADLASTVEAQTSFPASFLNVKFSVL